MEVQDNASSAELQQVIKKSNIEPVQLAVRLLEENIISESTLEDVKSRTSVAEKVETLSDAVTKLGITAYESCCALIKNIEVEVSQAADTGHPDDRAASSTADSGNVAPSFEQLCGDGDTSLNLIHVAEQNPNYYCPVTKVILFDPYQTTCCGHLISKRAFLKLSKSTSACPVCRSSEFSAFQDTPFRKKIRKLKVRCWYGDHGCRWEGCLDDLLKHNEELKDYHDTLKKITSIAPEEFILSGFEEFRKSWKMWFSPSFYTHPNGYRMCLRVDVEDNGHLSVHVYLMKGVYDDSLPFPFRGIVTIQLIQNQYKPYQCHIVFDDSIDPKHTTRVVEGERQVIGFGNSKFIPIHKLQNYLEHDSLKFRVTTSIKGEVTVQSISSKSIKVSWTLPQDTSKHGAILGYELSYSTLDGSTSVLNVGVTNFAEITGLKPYTTYNISVRTRAAGKYSEYHNPCTVTTNKDDIPSPPTGLKADRVCSTLVDISWQPPDDMKGFITEYQVSYTMHGGTEQFHNVYDTTSTYLTSLEPDTNYTVKVRAKITEFGDYSLPITFHTEIEVSKKVETLLSIFPKVTLTRVKNTKLIFYGAPRAGKTTLRKQLLRHVEGKQLEPCGNIERSTGLAEMNVSIFVQRRVLNKNENSHEFKWTVQELNDIATSLLLCLDNEQLKGKNNQRTKTKESTKNNTKAINIPHDLQKEQNVHVDEQMRHESQYFDGDKVTSQVVTSNLPIHLAENNKTTSQKSVDNSEGVDILAMFKKAVQTGHWEEFAAALTNGATFLQIIDSGGQPSFQEIFPLLISGSSLTLLIFKLTDALDKRSQVQHQPEEGGSESMWDDHYIVQDVIFDALSTFVSLRKRSQNETTTPSECDYSTALQSKILLVGTHKDKLDKEKDKETEILRIATQLHGPLSQSKVFKFIQVQEIKMLITGIANNRIEDIDLIKKKIEDMISVLEPRELPAPWLVYDFVLHKYGEQKGWKKVEKSMCNNIAKSCGIKNDDVDTVLHYLHNVAGTLLYYSDIPKLDQYVIIDFQLIFDSISKTIIQFFEDNSVHGAHLESKESLRKKGLLMASDLKNVPDCLEVAELLSLLQHRHVISEMGNNTFFMPCVLPKGNLSYNPSDNSSSFVVLFDHGCCPVGLFCATITELIVKHKWKIIKADQFRNKINFYSSCEKTKKKYKVIFSAFSVHYEVCLVDEAELGVKYMIHQNIKEALLKVCKDMDYNPPPSYGFYCPQHCKCGDNSYLPYQHPANCEFSDKSQQMQCYYTDLLSDLTEENKQWLLPPPQEKMDLHGQMEELPVPTTSTKRPAPEFEDSQPTTSKKLKTDNGLTILCDENHTEIFHMTKKACSNWSGIGRELGFTEDEITAIIREPGRTGEEDYYSSMLRRWLDWAPPNHHFPSVQKLSSVLRAVSKERLAFNLDLKYSVCTSN